MKGGGGGGQKDNGTRGYLGELAYLIFVFGQGLDIKI